MKAEESNRAAQNTDGTAKQFPEDRNEKLGLHLAFQSYLETRHDLSREHRLTACGESPDTWGQKL
jgi:hypothetical protein